MKLNKFFRIASIVALSFAVLIDTLVLNPVFASSSFEHHTEADGVTKSANWFYGSLWHGQTFTATSNHSISGIKVLMGGIGTPATITAHLRLASDKGNSSDLAYGVLNGASLTVLDDTYASANETINFVSSYSLVSGTQYFIAFSCGACDISNRPYIITDDDSPTDTYAGGGKFNSTDAGTTWPSSVTYDDLYFEVLGDSAPVVSLGAVSIGNEYIPGLQYSANITGHVDDDGNSDTFIVTLIRDYTDNGTYNYTGSGALYNTGDNFTNTIYYLTGGHTYQYYFSATNNYGTVNSSTGNFTVPASNGAPYIIPRPLLFTGNSGNLSALIYGQVIDDGNNTGNVTAGFDWREVGGSSFNSTNNTTNLSNSDLYYAQVSGLALNTTYEYKVRGFNAYGSYTPSVLVQFSLNEVYSPDITTLPASSITSGSAILNGEVDDLGNDPDLKAWFRFKASDSSTWIILPSFSVTETGVYSFDIADIYGDYLLQPNSVYDFEFLAEAHVIYNDNVQSSGGQRQFTTLEENRIPVVDTLTPVYLGGDNGISLKGIVIFDGNDTFGIWGDFDYKLETDLEWTDWPLATSGLFTGDNFTATIYVEPDKWYVYRACGSNAYGDYCDTTPITFRLSDNEIETTEPSDTDLVITFEEIVNNARESLHLTGDMGTWASMGLILLIIALIFGTVAFVAEGVARTAIMVIWMLISISVVGAFIFTNQLGIWPILILVGAVTILVMIFVSVKLSGGGNVNG